MSLITTDVDHALAYAYDKATVYGIPMEIYSRPLQHIVSIDEDTDIEHLQFIATENISDEIPDRWTLYAVIGITYE